MVSVILLKKVYIFLNSLFLISLQVVVRLPEDADQQLENHCWSKLLAFGLLTAFPFLPRPKLWLHP